MSTKDFSSKQENQISKLLGWSTVSASGARNFHPGDIRSNRWLGECKTHMKCSDKILFKFSEYSKICKESTEEFRFPALEIFRFLRCFVSKFSRLQVFGNLPHDGFSSVEKGTPRADAFVLKSPFRIVCAVQCKKEILVPLIVHICEGMA